MFRCSVCFLAIWFAGMPLIGLGWSQDDIGWHASGKGGAVAAGDARAVAAGMSMLRADGNAADGAAATLVALAVTDYGRFAIGGTVPLLIYDQQTSKVKVLSGCGRAPRDPAAIEWFYENGIPTEGSMKAAPVPGAIDLVVTLLREYGTFSFAQVVAPTLEILDQHEQPWHADLARTLRKLIDAEKRQEGERVAKLQAVSDCFYRGEIADELEQWYIAVGAFLRKSDLAHHRTLIEEPVSTDYRGYTVHKCGPWTQGPVLCQTLQLLERFSLKDLEHLSADYVHVVSESLKLALADRDEYYGDPEFVHVPLADLLSDEYNDARVSLINMHHASTERRPGDPRRRKAEQQAKTPAKGQSIPVQDTTTCVVADRWGNVVSATPSCNLVGNTPGPSGVTQGNRVRSLNTTPGHPNRVQAGKRPRITLTPTLVTKDGKPIVAISVAGGDLQDQTSLNVLLNYLEFGMLPAQAVTAPRFYTEHHENSFDSNPDRQAAFVEVAGLQLQEGFADEVQQNLASRGHRVGTKPPPLAHPVMLVIEPESGIIHAAGDPAADRHADAIP
ncbi:MAG: gamma-glutamyltransferase [Planctomycetales bacterium]|nr:gamma-glutamyltransferase [Planctomycetales bacterium]